MKVCLTHDPFREVQVTDDQYGVVHVCVGPIEGLVPVSLIVLAKQVIGMRLGHEAPGVGEWMAANKQSITGTPANTINLEDKNLTICPFFKKISLTVCLSPPRTSVLSRTTTAESCTYKHKKPHSREEGTPHHLSSALLIYS